MFDLVDAFSDDEALGTRDAKEEMLDVGVLEQAAKLEVAEQRTFRSTKFVDLSNSRGIKMRYELQGSINNPKLLYLPGVTDKLRKDMTKGLVKRLSTEFYTLACDLRNQGETIPCTWDVYVPQQTYVEDLISLVDAVFGPQEAVHVIGWGVGAVLALALARAQPSRVLRLAILSGGYWEAQTHRKSGAKGSAATQRETFGSDWPWIRDMSFCETLSMEERCRRMLLHADTRRHSEQARLQMVTPFECILEMFVRGEERSITCAKSEMLSIFALETMVFVEGTPNVERIVAPTVIVHGMHDGMHSLDRARELKRRMPWAQMEVLDEGHVLIDAAMPLVKEFFTTEAELPCGPIAPKLWDISNIKVKVLPKEVACNQVPQLNEQSGLARISMSYQRAVSMLDEIIAAYSRRAFQTKLSNGRSSAAGDKSQDFSWLQALCVKTQRPTLERYGFKATPSGLRECEEVIQELYGEKDITAKLRCVAELLQFPVVRKGIDGKIMCNLGSFRMSGAPQRLDSKIFAKAPVTHMRGLPVFADLTSTRGIHMRYELIGVGDFPKLLYIPDTTDDLRKDLTMTHSAAFSQHFHTLTCDLRNQGLTKPFMLSEYVPIKAHVDDLLALVDSIFGHGAAFHVVGWGFGAALALALARAHPNRVLGLALLAGGVWEPQAKMKDVALRPGLVYDMPEKVFDKDWTWVHDLSSHATLKCRERCHRTLMHADIRRRDEGFRKHMSIPFEGMLDMFEMSEELSVMHNPDQHAYGVLSHMISLFAEGTPGVEELVRPVLIVHGQHDGIHGVERAKQLHERMPWAELKVLEDQGHVIVLAAAHLVIKFLLERSPCTSLV